MCLVEPKKKEIPTWDWRKNGSGHEKQALRHPGRPRERGVCPPPADSSALLGLSLSPLEWDEWNCQAQGCPCLRKCLPKALRNLEAVVPRRWHKQEEVLAASGLPVGFTISCGLSFTRPNTPLKGSAFPIYYPSPTSLHATTASMDLEKCVYLLWSGCR